MNATALEPIWIHQTSTRRQFVIDGQVWDNYTHAQVRAQPLYAFLLPLANLIDSIMLTIVTTAGKQWYVDKVQDVAPLTNAKQQYVAWGTGSAAEAVGNTALDTEASESRVLGTLSQPAADTDRLTGTITADGSKTITESGRFNASTSGVMQQRALFTGLPLLADDSIIFDHDTLAQ